ncbi:TAXI family TRAP transporter solute-binding subunit [Aneurinibacillus aneurinilyticus]|uniref:TRAP transporter solute receptor, TAXI family n=1 Tax=Aneurinibacillus aneurinilyticus ATCC 12856 TaxID=649747 RepID=U1Y3S4_ANEAE|nr:TAXI family TRAP transporter solute-binding subunit [Aneurinibacillus aneurinilyticus]ERI05571.1 TRAP transporter solute receptor, TAXI family [Aneurinibacillus aneurinilyticus ATCC 12856]MCI1693672.1 TAXI family TRAP transporter solute-binding subunit [Aneurinibacillus aneurinilyticus]MED0671036.1 TAXI family TRAP transporter solute-binding subunit [Aneurinibacillus aneurinilyticus]MED0709303.1 TAXI family TRAP transporter solute-binding subunit [Aneurinibacillus aneurinilyticus]MED0724364
MNLRHLVTGAALLILCIMVGCSLAEKRQEIPSPVTHHPLPKPIETSPTPLLGKSITIATGDISGVYFPLGQALASTYGQYGGAFTGTRITKASIENTRLVREKKAELGFATVDAIASEEHALSAEKQPLVPSQLCALTGLYFNYIHIAVTKKSGIHSLKDLTGKRIGMGPIGSGTELSAERILQAAHLTNDTQKHYFSFSQASQALRDGVIDAAIFSSGLPNPDVSSLANDVSLTLISVPESVITELQRQYPYYLKKSIPAKTYAHLQSDIETIAVKNVLITYRDLPTDIAYELTKDFYTYLPELYDAHLAAREIDADQAGKNIYLPLHPGAARYFEEKKQKQAN